MVTLKIKHNSPTHPYAFIRIWNPQGEWQDAKLEYNPNETIQTAIDTVRKEVPDAVSMELVIGLPLTNVTPLR